MRGVLVANNDLASITRTVPGHNGPGIEVEIPQCQVGLNSSHKRLAICIVRWEGKGKTEIHGVGEECESRVY